MIQLSLIGIGTGHPNHLTLQAIEALQGSDLILIPNKGDEKNELAEIRRQMCQTHLGPTTKVVEFDLPTRDPLITDYRERVDRWHDAIAAIWTATISKNLGHAGRVGFLIWGDPSLYDSTLRIAKRVARNLPLDMTVIPGITSIQALTAAHAIPLNEINAPVVITTGRQIRDHGWPEGAQTAVVMLDGEMSFRRLPAENLHIWWSGYAGMAQEINIAGPVSEVTARIETARSDARARHGWIMDIYLLRRS